MFEQFDAKYPTPAHAAAAERSERERVQASLRHGRRSVLRDRAAKVTIAAALISAVAGAVVLAVGFRYAPTVTVRPPVMTDQVIPTLPPVPPAPVSPQVADARPPTRAAAPALRRSPRPATPTLAVGEEDEVSPVARREQPGSPWIADPLRGEALRLALIEDRKRTIELNDAELHRLTSKPPGE